MVLCLTIALQVARLKTTTFRGLSTKLQSDWLEQSTKSASGTLRQSPTAYANFYENAQLLFMPRSCYYTPFSVRVPRAIVRCLEEMCFVVDNECHIEHAIPHEYEMSKTPAIRRTCPSNADNIVQTMGPNGRHFPRQLAMKRASRWTYDVKRNNKTITEK